MPVPKELIFAKIMSNNTNTGQMYPLKARAISDGVSTWLTSGGMLVGGNGTGTAGTGTANGILNLIPEITSFSIGFTSNGLFSSEPYYLPVLLGLSQIQYPVAGASVGVGAGSWMGFVEISDPSSLIGFIEVGMTKNGVSGFYKSEITAWANSISSLFLTGSVVGGTITGTGSPASSTNKLTLLKVV